MEDTVNKKYIQALCALHEDDFTKNILKPLFESMGYERVDFNGGAYERGKDLIAQRRIPPRKEMHVVYVQSKKIGDIQNTAAGAKLSQLLHQLRQCCSTGIVDSDGHTIFPNEVYLACPEQMTNRLKEEINSQLFNLSPKIFPYDAPLIISDIKEYKPDLLELLTNIQDKLKFSNLESSDKELLSALKSQNKTCINDFYSDLSFFVGSFDSNLLLHLKIELNRNNLDVPEEKWESFKQELKNLSAIHEFNLINEDIRLVEEKFITHKKEFESEKNKVYNEKYKELNAKIDDLLINIENRIKALDLNFNPHANPLIKRLSNEEVSEKLDILASLKSSSLNKNIVKNKKDSFYADANIIISLLIEKNKFESELIDVKSKIVEKPFYKITIDSKGLKEKINSYKERYFNDIALINKKEIVFAKLKKFLFETQKTLSLISKLKSNDFLLSQIISFSHAENFQDRVSISPHDIFSTNHNIAVYGGAGVGKTTTLKAYADMMLEDKHTNLIYIPLNRLVDEFKKIMNNTIIEKTFKKDLLIKIILVSKSMSLSNEYIEDARISLSGKFTIILDGLDEVYSTIPDIISAISEFKENNPNSQFIVSSRDCVSYLSEIDFLGITLLPFTKEQLNKFIRGWLKDKNKAEKLISSIENRELFEHIKTPLLATITCSLVEKGINAPSTENEIYSERLRLLTGEYDLHKNIERQKQKGELLRKCAFKIAFYMHTKGVRSLEKTEILNTLINVLSENYSKKLLYNCLEELINPCNVLIIDPLTSKYSFGHFRFQEHMASEELKLDRNIDLSELVIHDWWRGALCLYAQDNDISHLIEDSYKRYGNIARAEITLESMINNSPKQKINSLKILLDEYIKSDKLDSLFLDNYTDRYEYEDYFDSYL